eukprot:10049652-Ditylum_brightwellii.AAC.1
MGKRKAKVLTTPAGSSAVLKFYCEMHGPNRTHNTKDFFELNQRAKRAKANPSHPEKGKMAYKDLNAFVNTKVTAVLKKAKKEQKEKKSKKTAIDAFDEFHSLKVDSSCKESNHEVNALAAASNDDSDSDDSCVPSEDSESDNK